MNKLDLLSSQHATSPTIPEAKASQETEQSERIKTCWQRSFKLNTWSAVLILASLIGLVSVITVTVGSLAIAAYALIPLSYIVWAMYDIVVNKNKMEEVDHNSNQVKLTLQRFIVDVNVLQRNFLEAYANEKGESRRLANLLKDYSQKLEDLYNVLLPEINKYKALGYKTIENQYSYIQANSEIISAWIADEFEADIPDAYKELLIKCFEQSVKVAESAIQRQEFYLETVKNRSTQS